MSPNARRVDGGATPTFSILSALLLAGLQSNKTFEIWLLVSKVGQCIEGKVGNYVLSKQLHKDIWIATSSNLGKVVIKSAPKYRFDNERNVLKHFHSRPGIRQLLDETQDIASLVLKHLDNDLLDASNSKRLENSEIKFIAKRILEALQSFHEANYVHTDVKPDNILINYGSGQHRFTKLT